jgi:hypothetical protein
MLLTNRLNFFDKKGNEINLLPQTVTLVTVVDPTNSGGYGATFNVYTSPEGRIVSLEITSGGYNYDITGSAYLRFENLITKYVWNSDPADLVVDPLTGTIIGFNGLSFTGNSDWKPGNTKFAYPNVTWLGEMYFDIVSTGLIENQDIFVLEQVVASPQTPGSLNYGYSFPRANEGPANPVGFYNNKIAVDAIESSTGVGSVSVFINSFNGSFIAGQKKIFSIASTASLAAGMFVEGTGIPAGTKIVSVDSLTQITIDSAPTQNGSGTALEAYVPHGFVAGMSIRVYDAAAPLLIAGTYDVVQVSNRIVYFSTPNTIPVIANTAAPVTMFFRAVPKWRGRMVGLEDEIFMFTVKYEEDFPVITKVSSFVHTPTDTTNLTSPDAFTAGITGLPAVGNFSGASVPGYQFRQVTEEWDERLMQFHLGFSAGTEGSYIRVFVLEDVTFPYAPVLISQISLRAEAQGEDERLGRLLQNFGRDVTENQELIFRDSDVFEDMPNFLLLNQKRKEMLLQGDQIWPYLGAYKGLVNIVNWFGYYDIRIKEYWLNVNKQDVYYRKYKQVQIPFQLEERGVPYGSLEMMPSRVYKKTNKFGLFYDLNKESGVLDENGVPQTIDAFQFSNHEILIKLFALKQYLEGGFIPLNAKIVDIVGEGVYYERYAANTWNDRVEQFVVELTRKVDFNANDTRIPIEDARRYDTNEIAYSYSPGTDTLQSYFATYTIKGVNIEAPLATVNKIPVLSVGSTSGNASPSKLWNGVAFVKAAPSLYTLSGNSDGGVDYSVGDIITLGGGVFSTPIRVKVITVGGSGDVVDIEVVTGLTQGSRYFVLPPTFSQTYVASEDLVNNIYYSGVGRGFKLDQQDIQYVLEGVKTTTQGKGYPILDPPVFTPADPDTGLPIVCTYNFNLTTVQGPYVGYFDQGTQLEVLTNEPYAPVAAFLELEATGFDVTWDEMIFSWDNLWSATEATLKAYVSPLPAGTGAIEAIEIIDPGSGYTRTPTVDFIGGDGINATATAYMRNGEVKILDLEVTSINALSPTSARAFFATPQAVFPLQVQILPTMFVVGTDTGGNSLDKPCVVLAYDTVGGNYVDISTSFNSVPGNFNIQIHAIEINSSGSAYTSTPEVKLTGGHTSTLYTWDEIGRGNFYDMEWKVTSEPGTSNFIYTSGQKSIDKLITHTVPLPYKGFYKVELIVYDTDNNWVNEIKRDYVEVYMPEALSSFATRYIGPSDTPGVYDGSGQESNILQMEQNCVDTWDEAFYMWDEFWGRWINHIKTWTVWDDCDILWDTLNVTPLSQENNWNYPKAPDYDVWKVSAYDSLVGKVTEFNPITGVVTVELSDVQNRPIATSFGAEIVYLRRDGSVFPVEATSATDFVTYVEYTISSVPAWPSSFEANPTAWEVLREVANTIVIQDDLYTPENGKTLIPGQYVTLKGDNNTPLNDSRWNLDHPLASWGIPIYAKNVDPVTTLYSGIITDGTSPITEQWVSGQIYNYRNQSYENGNLNLGVLGNPAPVVVETLDSPTEANWGNRAMFYVNNTNTNTYATTADLLKEVRPGFTEFDLVITQPDKTFWWAFDPLDPEISPPLIQPISIFTGAGAYRPSPDGGPGFIYGVYVPPSTNNAYYIDLEAATQNNISIAANVKKLFYVRELDRFFYPEGQTIGNDIYTLDPNTNTASLFTTLTSANSTNANMVFVRDGGSGYDMLYCATSDEFAYCVDANTGSIIAQIDTTPNTSCSGITYDPVRKRIWVLAGDNSPLSIIDADPNSPNWNTIIDTVSLPAAVLGIRYVEHIDRIIAFNLSVATTVYYELECSYPYTRTNKNISANWNTVTALAYHEADGHWWVSRNVGGTPRIDVYSFFDLSTPVYTINPTVPGVFRVMVYNPVTNSVWVTYQIGGIFALYEIKGKIFNEGTTLYEQHFRTIDMYEDSSNQGSPWNIWSAGESSIICIEATALEGKKFDELNNWLGQIDDIDIFGWIEYKYNVFPTRTYTSLQNGITGNLDITMDFNTRPILGEFENSIVFPAEPYTGRGWFFDWGISEGEYSQEIINVGEFYQIPGWSIVTVKDPNHELYRCDSTFKLKARDFDEDYADTHLGVKLGWSEVLNLDWDAMCSQTWNTIDWPYSLSANFRFVAENSGETFLQFNEYDPLYYDMPAVSYPEIAVFATNFLNNNIYDVSGYWGKNDNPGLSKFYYEVSSDTIGAVDQGFYTWGDPTDSNLYGDDTIAAVGDFVLGTNIQPGWEVSGAGAGQVTLGSSGAFTVGGAIPWIPACVIHGDMVAGSKVVSNIVGYQSDLPLAGWLWDPNALTIIGEFGPGIGLINENSGFVTTLTMFAPAATTVESFCMEVYPKRAGSVKFILSTPASDPDIVINAYAKSPGADSLGYVRSNTNNLFVSNHYIYEPGVSDLTEWNHTFPLGNYYNWVQNRDIFYGAGLENSLLQFAQPYRNIQTYIYEGGENRYSDYNAVNGGWYPSKSWSSPNGQVDGFPFLTPIANTFPNLYKPGTVVSIFDVNGNAIVPPTPDDLYLVLNSFFDGQATIYNAGSPFDFSTSTFFAANYSNWDQYPIPIVIKFASNVYNSAASPVSSETLTIEAVVVNPQTGLIGRNAVYFNGTTNIDGALIFDPETYQITSITQPTAPFTPALMPSPIESLKSGMVIGEVSGGPVLTNQFKTKIISVDNKNSLINIDIPIDSAATAVFYAYTPLDLNIKIQPVTRQLWSSTEQWDSMRLQYESSINSAFTWEDTTISLRERKIPAGCSVLFSSDASDIAGKTHFLWNLYHDGTKVCSIEDSDFMWTFLETGLYDLELEITDTNGNTQSRYNKDYIEVYMADRNEG